MARCKAAKTEQCVCDGGLEDLPWIDYALKPDGQSFIHRILHDTEVEIPLLSPNTRKPKFKEVIAVIVTLCLAWASEVPDKAPIVS